MLVLSGVLKQVVDQQPNRRFNVLRRTGYGTFLRGHPAVACIACPPQGARIQRVDYWLMETMGPGLQRPFQILARGFGLPTPAPEQLYVPWEIEDDPVLWGFIPWKSRNVVIAPASDSPRKMMHPMIWDRLVHSLVLDDALVLQVGRSSDVHIRGSYSLLGLTTPRQLIALLRRADLVITSDSFVMHAAHLVGARTVVVWGPTWHEVYGYPEQVHLQAKRTCGLALGDDCIGPGRNEGGRLYTTQCPHRERHCMDLLTPEAIHEAARKAGL